MSQPAEQCQISVDDAPQYILTVQDRLNSPAIDKPSFINIMIEIILSGAKISGWFLDNNLEYIYVKVLWLNGNQVPLNIFMENKANQFSI